MRYFIEIAYQGTHYHGWQIQKNAYTVQAALHKALSILLREKVETIGSGRTDTGVHALQQFVHLDTEKELQMYPHVYQLNALLPQDIAIRNVYRVPDRAHARFDATFRKYEYRISFQKNPFLTNLCYVYRKPLDVPLMNEAAQKLISYTDFECFSRVKTEVNHFLCTVYEAYWKDSNGLLVFHIKANRFLRGMVRAIVGTLLEIGAHNLAVADFEKIIESKDRKKAGRAVPPEGLFLTEVQYESWVFSEE